MSDRGHVLVVEDDAALGRVLVALLEQEGIAATYVSAARKAISALEERPFDVVVTDLRMPDVDGMELLRHVVARWPGVPVVMLTAHGTVPLAVEAMKAGAADFVLKPFDRDELLFVVKKALQSGQRAAAEEPASAIAREILGESAAMQEVHALVRRAASGTATVLVLGETGTGKELVARAVHDASPRRGQPFIKLHCGALPESLLESELFGYEKGAFTGAVARKPGRIELAQGGTLFLDEIGDVSPATQVKLLRVLQEREVERLGGTEPIKVDVRFVAATHRNLPAMVAAGEFREDLYYRLNVVPIVLPALRDRGGDVELLARRFAKDLGTANGKGAVTIDDAAMDRLRRDRWPGNVRQLQNFVERLVVLSDGMTLRLHDVERELARVPGGGTAAATATAASAPTGESASLGDAVRLAEKEALVRALEKAGDNRTLAARLLGVSRRGFYKKMQDHGLR